MWKFAESFLTFKGQSPIIQFEIKSCSIFFFKFPKMAKTVFYLKKCKTKICPPFSSVFAFKQTKKQMFSGVTFKNVK